MLTGGTLHSPWSPSSKQEIPVPSPSRFHNPRARLHAPKLAAPHPQPAWWKLVRRQEECSLVQLISSYLHIKKRMGASQRDLSGCSGDAERRHRSSQGPGPASPKLGPPSPSIPEVLRPEAR